VRIGGRSEIQTREQIAALFNRPEWSEKFQKCEGVSWTHFHHYGVDYTDIALQDVWLLAPLNVSQFSLL
jgi:hypothetical protein